MCAMCEADLCAMRLTDKPHTYVLCTHMRAMRLTDKPHACVLCIHMLCGLPHRICSNM